MYGVGPVAPSRREQNKVEKRRRIVAAGRFLFRTVGFEATTTAAIAAQAGVGTGTFYLYASSKEDLLVEVFQEEVAQAWSDALALVDPERALVQQLDGVFGHVTLFHEGDPELARAFFKELLFVSASARAKADEVIRGIHEGLEAILKRAQQRGELDSTIPARHLARNLFALWYPILQRRYAGFITTDEALNRYRTALRTALWGLVEQGRTGTV